MDFILRELKFLWEDHTPEYKKYLEGCQDLQLRIPVALPRLCKFFRVQDGCVLQWLMLRGYYRSQSFQCKSTDIFVVSFPKTGTTWTQEIVYLIGNDVNFKKAKSVNLERRFPLLEFSPSKHRLQADCDIRYYKSHLPYSMLPESVRESKCKIVYVTRNPKDTVVSMWYFYKLLKHISYRGPLSDFVEMFINDQVIYAPYPKTVLEFWERRNDGNILFIMYEEIKRDMRGSLRRVSEFLGKTLTEDDVNQIAKHCSFQEMSANPMANYAQWKENGMANPKEKPFMRKGSVGDWRNHFDEAMNKKMDAWIEHHFAKSGIPFIYEL